MTQSSLLLGYEPRCSVYPRKSGKRKVYYLSYFLPNGKRFLRFCHEKKSLATKVGHLKEEELLKDQSHIMIILMDNLRIMAL